MENIGCEESTVQRLMAPGAGSPEVGAALSFSFSMFLILASLAASSSLSCRT